MKNFILTFLLLLCVNANANEIFNKNKNDISKIENYLNSIEYFSSDFIQDDNISSVLSEGKFYLSRPGKLRLEYTIPSKILLITNDKSTVYYDVELEEFTKIPTKKTPIHFLTKDNFDFQNSSMKIVDFEKIENKIVLSLMEKDKEQQGRVALIFQARPMELRGIRINNELSQEIEVNFSKIAINSKIENGLFVFKNPKSNEEIRTRY